MQQITPMLMAMQAPLFLAIHVHEERKKPCGWFGYRCCVRMPSSLMMS